MEEADERQYKRAGVDLGAAARTMHLITREVESTYTPSVLKGIGAFGGLFALPTGYRDPVLVASTDGVGTKVMLVARHADQLTSDSGAVVPPGVQPERERAAAALASVGGDLVNHCVNDILVQGARPLFFLDYVASSRLVPEVTAALVSGIASACRAAGVALLGGETAEMPGVYRAGEFDLAGTIVGIVERDEIVDGSTVEVGDVLLALPSGGLQTNGFSLAREVLAGAFDERLTDGSTVLEALLAPHRSFLPDVAPHLERGGIKALAHITGGGLPDNLPRALPAGLGCLLHRGSWPEPPIFAHLQARGEISDDEMFAVFNMGIGLVLIASPERSAALLDAHGEGLWQVGEVTAGGGVVVA